MTVAIEEKAAVAAETLGTVGRRTGLTAWLGTGETAASIEVVAGATLEALCGITEPAPYNQRLTEVTGASRQVVAGVAEQAVRCVGLRT